MSIARRAPKRQGVYALERIGTLAPMAKEPREGPRGGKTTRSKSGMVRKSFWIDPDVEEALRRMAFEDRRSESEIVREALRRFFQIEA